MNVRRHRTAVCFFLGFSGRDARTATVLSRPHPLHQGASHICNRAQVLHGRNYRAATKHRQFESGDVISRIKGGQRAPVSQISAVRSVGTTGSPDLKQPLKRGEKVPVTLEFERQVR